MCLRRLEVLFEQSSSCPHFLHLALFLLIFSKRFQAGLHFFLSFSISFGILLLANTEGKQKGAQENQRQEILMLKSPTKKSGKR